MLFDKWCAASKVTDFNSLRELILLEDFKRCTPERCVVYLNEQKITTLNDGAIFADKFTLTHKGVFASAREKPADAARWLTAEMSEISPVTFQRSARVFLLP